jgi:hypothetical protein
MVDTGRSVGVRTPVHPISGEKRREQESIVAFARRHGWEVTEQKERDDYFTTVYFDRDGKSATLHLYPGRTRDVATARTNNGITTIDIRVHGKEMRKRIEAFLAGVQCICTDKNLFYYENVADSACQIHGRAAL